MSSSAFTWDQIVTGDARSALSLIPSDSVDLSFWSPPYHVGKAYEKGQTFHDWKELVSDVIRRHYRIVKPGGFLAINIGDILCFADPSMPRFQADNVSRKKIPITRKDVLKVMRDHPGANRYELARIMGCSEQTIQRRLEGNNVRGGKNGVSTKILLTGCLIVDWSEDAGFYLYDQRIWHKDPCWANSQWHSNSYRSVDEFEHVYVLWKPGVTEYDRDRLDRNEWSAWGSRGVWQIPSVRANHRHEAEFPEELARRVISLFSPRGGTVIDPFVGSGTTTSVAKRLDRRYYGIDQDAGYAKLAQRRMDRTDRACSL